MLQGSTLARSSCKFLRLLFAAIIEFLGNSCFNVWSVSNKCLCLLIISLTFGPQGLNSAENITEAVLMERVFLFHTTEHETFFNFIES